MIILFLLQNLHHIPPRRAADSSSAVDSATTEIQIFDGCFVIRPARKRTHEHELVEHQLTMVEVAFGETVGGLQVLRREGLCIFD